MKERNFCFSRRRCHSILKRILDQFPLSPVSHFQDSQNIDLLTPSFNFPEKVHFFRVKELYYIKKKIIKKCDTLCVLRCFTRTLAQICLFPFELDLPKIRQKWYLSYWHKVNCILQELFSDTPTWLYLARSNTPPNMAKYANYGIWGTYLGASNMVKWAFPEKIS